MSQSPTKPKPKPVVLAIMDGWGHRVAQDHNAIALANTPAIDTLDKTCPKAFLATSGEAVGLPKNQVGNSEVGHQTIGAGRVTPQDLLRINTAIRDGSFATSSILTKLADSLVSDKQNPKSAHIIGLVSDGGVHSHSDHIIAIAQALATRQPNLTIYVHAISDGRDSPPKAAHAHLTRLKSLPKTAKIATLGGRYFAMDRDQRWQRTRLAWLAMSFGSDRQKYDEAAIHHYETAAAAIDAGYQRGESDEFITPSTLGDYHGMADGDAVVMANFRADRVRQLLAGWIFPDSPLARMTPPSPRISQLVAMTSYSAEIDRHAEILFPPQPHTTSLAEAVSAAQLRQLRLAETEKYPHVTFFFNGGRESPFAHEDRCLVASPKIATYDLKPTMSIEEVADALLTAITQQSHDMIIVNFANPDMVGHTGDLTATIAAVEAVDKVVGESVAALNKIGGCMLLTSDHGNCETMWDVANNSPHTAHTTNPVPIWWVGAPAGASLADGGLCDLAPSMLELLGVAIPHDMTGKSLLRHRK
ncbi:MAG: 2,3-bisphosphoglycerate-independent phosphoglycerate mutase [Proteobacteria bacterium]|nr:2,3-bisphosphoglycerate-independent phosphoglycerate mutase [Pseudomonadota bacterium]